jgi:hypothetical protein
LSEAIPVPERSRGVVSVAIPVPERSRGVVSVAIPVPERSRGAKGEAISVPERSRGAKFHRAISFPARSGIQSVAVGPRGIGSTVLSLETEGPTGKVGAVKSILLPSIKEGSKL